MENTITSIEDFEKTYLPMITSMEDFERKYFPEDYARKKEQRILNGTPEETGKYLAKQSIDKIIKSLKN